MDWKSAIFLYFIFNVSITYKCEHKYFETREHAIQVQEFYIENLLIYYFSLDSIKGT